MDMDITGRFVVYTRSLVNETLDTSVAKATATATATSALSFGSEITLFLVI